MALGKRIQQRLTDLGWERKDLLAKVPGLSPASLSNLITRDSRRSEFDVLIAGALGISVLELVYGETTPYPPQDNVVPLQASEPRGAIVELIAIAETMSERGIIELIGAARVFAQQHPKAKANPAI